MYQNSRVIPKQKRKRADSQGWLASSSSVSHPVCVSQSVCLSVSLYVYVYVCLSHSLTKKKKVKVKLIAS